MNLNALRVQKHIRWRLVGDEGVVLNQDQGEVLVLNKLGIRILELLENSVKVGDLTEVLLQEYEVDAATLETDIQKYIDELLTADVVSYEMSDT